MGDTQSSPDHDQRPLEIETIVRGLIRWGDSILLCSSVKRGYAYLPGGHVEFGESAEDALLRELDEECGGNWTVGPCLLVHEHVFRQKGVLKHEWTLVFHVEHVGRPITSMGASPPPPVESREPKIAFSWADAAQFARADFQPVNLREWVETMYEPAALDAPRLVLRTDID